jgi:hypothetical protein
VAAGRGGRADPGPGPGGGQGGAAAGLRRVDRAPVRLRHPERRAGEPEEWLDLTEHGAAAGELHYLNGIVAAHDRATLLVAAQGTGVLWRADVGARAASPVDLGGERVNGDGLAFAGGLLYACDNTDEPDGSVRYWLTALRLSADARAATLAGRWERQLADTPTTLAYLDGRLYQVNSQFGARRGAAALPRRRSPSAPCPRRPSGPPA